MKKWIMTICLAVILLTGCVRGVDPTTGRETVSVDPNVAEKVEGGTQALVSIGTILSVFIPSLTGVVGIIAGVLGAWRKAKPLLTKAQSEANMYHSVASSTVLGIDEFKKLCPKEAEKLLAELEKLKKKMIKPEDWLKIENVILALRGKPIKRIAE